jgi:hypothetical protein
MRRYLSTAAAGALALALFAAGCSLAPREQHATETAVIGFFAGSAVGCTAAAIADSREAFAIGCPIGMVLGAGLGWAYGYANYTGLPATAAPMPPLQPAPRS